MRERDREKEKGLGLVLRAKEVEFLLFYILYSYQNIPTSLRLSRDKIKG